MSSSAPSISRAAVCGVSETGSQVVHTWVAARAPSATFQSAEQVRPTANSSRLRYCRLSLRSSASGSQRSSVRMSATGRNIASPPASTDRLVWNIQASTGIRRGASRSLHNAISTSSRPWSRRASIRSVTSSISGHGPGLFLGQVGDRDGNDHFHRRAPVVADRPSARHSPGL